MGCNTPRPLLLSPPALAPPAGAEFPDVSNWQGAVNRPAVKAWQRSHGWRAAAIFKLGEYTLDSQAARNAQQTAALGFWRAGYWFVRATGCSHEAAQIVWAAQRFAVKVVVFDSEVPEARGYDACMAPIARRAGLTVVEYTSPGSNPDPANPGLPVWTAAFGPARTPCVWTCLVGFLTRQSILAWQFTDGRWGPWVAIPGLGHGDVNVDYGITRLPYVAPKPPPIPQPSPICFTHRESKASCDSVKARVASDLRAAASSQRALAATNAALRANKCQVPYRRAACVRKGRDAQVFAQRVRYFRAAAAKLEAAN